MCIRDRRIASFTSGHSVAVYLFIFFGKILEVSISTLRTVLINKGMRVVGCITAVLEYLLWLFITASVLTGYQEDPMKVIALTLAFALEMCIRDRGWAAARKSSAIRA